MRLAWTVVMLATGAGLAAVAACSAFSPDAEPTNDGGATDGPAQMDGPAKDGGGPAVDGCVVLGLGADPKNCGACGHDCLGGACLDGGCQPKRVAVATANIASVAVTSAGVHWLVVGGSAIFTCPPAGCTDAGTLASALSTTTQLVSVGESLAVLGATQVKWVTEAGAATPVGGAYDSTKTIVSDGAKTIYYVAQAGTQRIWGFDDVGDAGPTTLLDNNSLLTIGVAGTHLFYYLGNGIEFVGICDLPSCTNPRRLVNGAGVNADPQTLLAPNEDALFYSRVSGELYTCAVAGCSAATQLHKASQIASLASDEKYVYFTTGNDMTVNRCPVAGCGGSNLVVLARGPDPHALVITKNAIYWATDTAAADPPAIWRLAK